tara:strand:+ start:605 stop:844 length:240 start_codon:yes stop_codon:yes gene_type:complete
MEMIILNDEELQQLEAINTENVHLNRAISPVSLGENKHAVNVDILTDQITWSHWIELLQDKPREDIDLPIVSNEDLELE